MTTTEDLTRKHTLCDPCLDGKPPSRHTEAAGTDRCCKCGRGTDCPVYILADDNLMPCQGQGHPGTTS